MANVEVTADDLVEVLSIQRNQALHEAAVANAALKAASRKLDEAEARLEAMKDWEPVKKTTDEPEPESPAPE